MSFDQLPQDMYIELFKCVDYFSLPRFIQINRTIATLAQKTFANSMHNEQRKKLNRLMINNSSSYTYITFSDRHFALPFPIFGAQIERYKCEITYPGGREVNVSPNKVKYIVTSFIPKPDRYGFILSLCVKPIVEVEDGVAMLGPNEEIIRLYPSGWQFHSPPLCIERVKFTSLPPLP